MNVFGSYAAYYDLLYSDKDYEGEAKFVHRLLQKHAPDADTILDLGCGTGVHASLLAKEGYRVHGIDVSTDMLEKANSSLSQFYPELKSKLQFSLGDIRTIELKKQFDAVVVLFHVMSYQVFNKDLQSVFNTIKKHLKPGGILIFDCWYGPAVLSVAPSTRIKRLENEEINVTRIAEPVMYPNNNSVDVNYHVFIRNKSSGSIEELSETHRMRYLFKPEIDLLFVEAELKLIEFKEWMTNNEPGVNTWGVYFVGRG